MATVAETLRAIGNDAQWHADKQRQFCEAATKTSDVDRAYIEQWEAKASACEAGARAWEAQQWHPIETLRVEGDQQKFNCLVSDGQNVWEAWYEVERNQFYEPNAERGDEYERELFPTHWMPMPDPPEARSLVSREEPRT